MFVSEPPSHLLLLEGSIGIQYSTFILCITPHHATVTKHDHTQPFGATLTTAFFQLGRTLCSTYLYSWLGSLWMMEAQNVWQELSYFSKKGDHTQLVKTAPICKKTKQCFHCLFATPHTLQYVHTIETMRILYL